jgi:hypothetical protein
MSLTPVSTKPAALVANLPPVYLTPAEILPPVSLIPMVQLHLRISPPIFTKKYKMIQMFFWGLWEDDS